MIDVIFAAPRKDPSFVSGVMTISPLSKVDEKGRTFKKFKLQYWPILGFFEADKEETILPYDDALVVTLQIVRFDVKRVMIN